MFSAVKASHLSDVILYKTTELVTAETEKVLVLENSSVFFQVDKKRVIKYYKDGRIILEVMWMSASLPGYTGGASSGIAELNCVKQ